MTERFNPYRQFVGSFIPNALMSYPGLTSTAKLLWARLAQYAGQNGACFPSQQRLAADLGLSDRQVRKIISELISKGFLEKEAPPYKEQIQGKTIKYFFLMHPIFRPEPEFLPDRNQSSGGSGTTVPEPTEPEFHQRESEKEKNEKGSSPPDFQKSQEKAKSILKQLGSKFQTEEAKNVHNLSL